MRIKKKNERGYQMEKMKVILADDHISSRTILSRFTQLLPDFEVIGEATNGEELVQMVISKKPDIVLVDVNMPILTGMQAVKICRNFLPSLQIIFTTGYDEFAVEAFDVAAVDYVVKPIEKTRLFVALEKARQAVQGKNKFGEKAENSIAKKLLIKSKNKFIYLSVEDILFIEKEGRKSILHTIGERYETTESLQELEESLPNYFYKSHRSYLINLNKIEKIEPCGETYLVYFSSSEKVAHISRLKINKVFELMGS